MRAKLLLALAVVGCSFSVSGEIILSQELKNQLLKEELALARAPSAYFVVDLQTRKFQLKASGLTLREWKIEKLRRWGDPVPLRALSIEKKSALFAPKRKKIKPGANEEGGARELEVLELKDMPSSFSLCLDKGLYIYVRPRPDTLLSKAWEISRFLRWYTWIPLKNLWFEVKKKPLTTLELRLSNKKEEAKSLYWALLEGHKGLIYPF